MGSADTGQHVWPRPIRPIFNHGLVAEVSMKLIENHALARRLRHDVFGTNVGILSCPANFDQVFFLLESHAKRRAVARTGIDDDTRVHSCDMRLHWKAHAGSISHEGSEIKTKWFRLRLLRVQARRREE